MLNALRAQDLYLSSALVRLAEPDPTVWEATSDISRAWDIDSTAVRAVVPIFQGYMAQLEAPEILAASASGLRLYYLQRGGYFGELGALSAAIGEYDDALRFFEQSERAYLESGRLGGYMFSPRLRLLHRLERSDELRSACQKLRERLPEERDATCETIGA